MTSGTIKSCTVALGCAGWLAGLCGGARAHAQPTIGTAENFSTSEYFAPPNEQQAKFRITGAEAQPLTGGRYLIKQLRLETFLRTGEPELVVEAPECLYDSMNGQAASPGRLRVQSGDGRLSVAGEGFLWQEGRSSLMISNDVRSVIQRAVTNAAPAPPPATGRESAGAMVITSRTFVLEATNRHAVFQGDVHGEDSEMKFACGWLEVRAGSGDTTATASAPGGHSFDVIEAWESPEISSKLDGRRATADRMIFTRTDEIAELIGNVAWQQGRQEGTADRAVVRRRENEFLAEGRVAMKLPRESLGGGGVLLSGASTPRIRLGGDPVKGTTESGPLADLFADRFHSRSNLLVAEGAVYLQDGTNRLFCDKLTTHSAIAPSPEETAIAEGNVAVEKGDDRLCAAHAVYTKSSGTIVFTGDPTWSQAQMQGQAESVTIHAETGEIYARNQVAVKLPAGGQSASLLTLFPVESGTNRAPTEIEVFAREVAVTEPRAVFSGKVRAHQLPLTGHEPRLRSDELEVVFATASRAGGADLQVGPTPTGRRAETIQARQNVVYEQGQPGVTNGPAMYRKLSTRRLTARSDPQTGAVAHLLAEGEVRIEQPGNLARGGRATYTAATDLLELTDRPTLETPDMIITDAQTLFWDKAHNRFSGTGQFKITPKPEAAKHAAEKLKSP